MTEHRRITAGVRLAVTTLTVAPVRSATVDRATAGIAMSLAPAIGAALGVAIAAIGLTAYTLGATPFLAAVLMVGAGVALTRGLHLDGLADTADALGSYRDRGTALAIMRSPDVGPFGVVAVVLVLLAQIAAAATLLARPWYAAISGVVASTAAGRLAVTVACRRGVPAARTNGLGALVAGTVGRSAPVLGVLGVAGVAIAAVPGRPWQGPLAVGLSLIAAVAFVHHVVRRLGGITGDVLGATCEISAAVTYVVASM